MLSKTVRAAGREPLAARRSWPACAVLSKIVHFEPGLRRVRVACMHGCVGHGFVARGAQRPSRPTFRPRRATWWRSCCSATRPSVSAWTVRASRQAHYRRALATPFTGYAALRSHAFFEVRRVERARGHVRALRHHSHQGLDWDTLHSSPAPTLLNGTFARPQGVWQRCCGLPASRRLTLSLVLRRASARCQLEPTQE